MVVVVEKNHTRWWRRTTCGGGEEPRAVVVVVVVVVVKNHAWWWWWRRTTRGGGPEPPGPTARSRSMLGGPGFRPHLGIFVGWRPCGDPMGPGWCRWLLGTCGRSRATGRSTAVTGIYLVASVQQHPRGGEDVHGVEVEGAGRRVVGGLGNLLRVGERRGRTSPCRTSPAVTSRGWGLRRCPARGAASLAAGRSVRSRRAAFALVWGNLRGSSVRRSPQPRLVGRAPPSRGW